MGSYRISQLMYRLSKLLSHQQLTFTETELGPRRNTNPFFNDGAANSNYRVPYFTSHGITSTNTGTAGWMDVRTRNDKSGNYRYI